MKIIFLGSGNLATRLSLEMHRKGMQIGQVYSHTPENAQQLAALLGCPWTTDPETVDTDADLYVFSLKDTVLADVIARVRPNEGLWVHTAAVCRWMFSTAIRPIMESCIRCRRLVKHGR